MANLIPALVQASLSRRARTGQAAQSIGSDLSAIGNKYKKKKLWEKGKKFISGGKFNSADVTKFMRDEDLSEEEMSQIMLYTKIFQAMGQNQQKFTSDQAQAGEDLAYTKAQTDFTNRRGYPQAKAKKLSPNQANAIKLMHFKSKGWIPNELGGYNKVNPNTGETTPVTQQEVNNEEIELQNIIAKQGNDYQSLSSGYQKIFQNQNVQAQNAPAKTGPIGDLRRLLEKVGKGIGDDVISTGPKRKQLGSAPNATQVTQQNAPGSQKFYPVNAPRTPDSGGTEQNLMDTLQNLGQGGSPGARPGSDLFKNLPNGGGYSPIPGGQPPSPVNQSPTWPDISANRERTQGVKSLEAKLSPEGKSYLTPKQIEMIVKALARQDITFREGYFEGRNFTEEDLVNELNQITQGR
jgi:hypothetical protein